MTDTFYLKLAGKVNIPSHMEIGHNYRVLLDGSVTGETKTDNEDGTYTVMSKFEPIVAEIQKDHGEMVKSKDVRSMATKVRHMLYRKWEANSSPLGHEEYYERVMRHIINNLEELAEEATG
jgi:hypothetical protein